ncbi:hypothetical protein [Variovorax sp. UC122_21]
MQLAQRLAGGARARSASRAAASTAWSSMALKALSPAPAWQRASSAAA